MGVPLLLQYTQISLSYYTIKNGNNVLLKFIWVYLIKQNTLNQKFHKLADFEFSG